MISKFNKNVICCLALAVLGGGRLNAEELMMHHVKAGVHFTPRFMKPSDSFKAITKKDNFDAKGFQFGIGGELEYVCNFCPLFGVGLNVGIDYTRLAPFSPKTAQEGASNTDGNNKDKKNDDSITFHGISIDPALVFNFNFLEDGVMYDESTESAAGFGLSARLLAGCQINIGLNKKDEVKKILSDKFGVTGENSLAMGMFVPKVGVDVEGTLPFGLYFGLGFNVYGMFMNTLNCVDKDGKLVKADSLKYTENGKDVTPKTSKLDLGLNVKVGYDLAGLFM